MLNQIKTVILLAALAGLLMLIGGLIGGWSGVVIALIISLIFNGFAYFYSDKLVLKMYNAKPLPQQEYPKIYEIVKELAQKTNIPMPKLWIIDTPMANAFATGRNPQYASVAVTTGILNILDYEELRGVLAHELSHVLNRDILVSTVAAILATAVGFLANIMQNLAFWSTVSTRNQRGPNPFVLLVVAIVMPIAATLIQLAISRSREYFADEHGAEISHDPMALASALEKLQASIKHTHLSEYDTQHATSAHLFIVWPFSGRGITALFATHPPIEKRIAKLRAIYEKMKGIQ